MDIFRYICWTLVSPVWVSRGFNDGAMGWREDCSLHTNAILGASGDDNHIALPCFMIRCSTHSRATVAAVDDIGEIADLAVSHLSLDVNEEQLIGDGAENEGIRSRGANLADADDGHS